MTEQEIRHEEFQHNARTYLCKSIIILDRVAIDQLRKGDYECKEEIRLVLNYQIQALCAAFQQTHASPSNHIGPS